jgi:chemotaxis protein CheD
MAMTDCSVTVKRVGIAEGAVIHRPWRLRTLGLGSCVGLVVYDVVAGVAGMVHVMLPQAPRTTVDNPEKYADLAVPWLVHHVLREGAERTRLQAKLAGGAQMFTTRGSSPALRVGERNVASVLQALTEVRVPVVAQDVGGSSGRTIEFDTETTQLWVRTATYTYAI